MPLGLPSQGGVLSSLKCRLPLDYPSMTRHRLVRRAIRCSSTPRLLFGYGCKTGSSARLIKRLPPRRPDEYRVHQHQPRSWMRVGAAIKGVTPLISQGGPLINHLSQPRPCLPHNNVIDVIGLPGLDFDSQYYRDNVVWSHVAGLFLATSGVRKNWECREEHGAPLVRGCLECVTSHIL